MKAKKTWLRNVLVLFVLAVPVSAYAAEHLSASSCCGPDCPCTDCDCDK